MSAPAAARIMERLKHAALPCEELLELLAESACHSAATRRLVDAHLAVADPLPEKQRDEVALSPDLIPHIFETLGLEDCAASSVCKEWALAWTTRNRQTLRAVPLPQLDFALESPSALAVLPGGEQLCIAEDGETKRVRIVDKNMRLLRTLGGHKFGIRFPGTVTDMVAGVDGLYVAERTTPPRVRRFKLDTFAVAATHALDTHWSFYSSLALAPGGPLFVANENSRQVLALDALTLEVRFDCWSLGGDVSGLAVRGDELFMGMGEDNSICVLSLAGELRRTIDACDRPAPGKYPQASRSSLEPWEWRAPFRLCCVADRLFFTEYSEMFDYGDPELTEDEQKERRMAGRHVIVLTPEGTQLQAYQSPRPLEEECHLHSIVYFDGKLVVADGQRELLALEGF